MIPPSWNRPGWNWPGRLLAAAAILGSVVYLAIVIDQYLYQRDVAAAADMVVVESFLSGLHRFPTLVEAFTFHDNEHRPAFPLYVFSIDHFYFASRALLPVLLSFLSIAGACGLCLWHLLPAIRQPASRLAYLLIFPVVMFWPAHYLNFVWAKQFHACLSVFCICASFAMAAGIDARLAERPRRAAIAPLAAMALFIFVGAFSFGWGLLACLVIGSFVLWRRWPIGYAAPVLAVVIATVALYAFVSRSLNPGTSIQGLGAGIAPAISYFLRFLGSPLTSLIGPHAPDGQSTRLVAETLTAVALMATTAMFFRRRRDRRDRDPATLAALNLADLLLAFSIVCALATMKTRILLFPRDADSSRYLFVPALFWLALLFHLAWREPVTPRLRWLGPAIVAAVGAGIVLGTPTYFAAMAQRSFDHRLGSIVAVMGDGMPPRLARAPEFIIPLYADYAANGTSVYAEPWPHWLGMNATTLAPADVPVCQGSILTVSPVQGSADRQVQGRLTRPDGGTERAWLAFANRDGTVIGLGTNGPSLPIGGYHGQLAPLEAFAGFIRGSQSDLDSIYAWFGGTDWCRLSATQ